MSVSSNKYYIEGKKLSDAGEYQASLDLFTKALKTEENPGIYYERALSYYYLKDISSALEDLNHALELDPENPFRYSSRAYIRDRSGDTEGAIEDYKKAIELDPEDAIAYNNLGLLEEKAGFNEMAKKRFETADMLAKESGLFEELLKPETPHLNGYAKEASPDVSKIFKKPLASFSLRPYITEIIRVFTTRSGWKEFLRFIKNGGKIR